MRLLEKLALFKPAYMTYYCIYYSTPCHGWSNCYNYIIRFYKKTGKWLKYIVIVLLILIIGLGKLTLTLLT